MDVQPVSNRQKRSKSYKEEFGSYMKDVQGYLGKVRRGRSVRDLDEDQPAFDTQAETVRQGRAVDKANAKSNAYDRLLETSR